jgi:ribonuclease HI
LHTPRILCLQELHLHQRTLCPPPNFSSPIYTIAGDPSCRTGSAILIHSTLSFTTLTLQTPLQAVAIRIFQTTPLTICSLYLPPCVPYSFQDFQQLLSQLPPPVLLVGDFNLRHTLWGDTVNSPIAEKLIPLLFQYSYTCLNGGQPTFERLNPPSSTCIDISFSTSTILHRFHWQRLPSLHGSDHYPILVTSAQQQTVLPPPPKWNYARANWPSFTQSTSITHSPFHPSFHTVDDAYTHFHSVISSAATTWIPQAHSPTSFQTPWWNPTCKQIHALKEHLYRQYKKHRTSSSLIAYKAANATCRRTLRQARRTFFHNFSTTLTVSTPVRHLYNMVHRITHHTSPTRLPAIKFGPNQDDIVSTPGAVADYLGYSFANISSVSQYSPTFLHKHSSTHTPCFSSPEENTLPYNRLFTLAEFKQALHSFRPTAPGPDNISLPMLQHAHPTALSFLLDFINRCWWESKLPAIWTSAIVVPIPKPGKDPTDPLAYRPISMTSVPNKIMERLVANRLSPLLDTLNALTPFQFGFRRSTSTTEPLLRFDFCVRQAFSIKHGVLAAFLDLQHAYDTTWRTGILLKLHSLGLRGALPSYVQALLSQRTFRVRCSSVLSRQFTLEEGVPQGGVLSGLLFLLAINDIHTVIPSSVQYSLYADDILLYVTGSSLSCITRQLQLAITHCAQWGSTHGFKFSPSKSAVIHFTRAWSRRSPVSPPPTLYLTQTQIPICTQHRFLGVIFDHHLTYKAHILHVRSACLRILDYVKNISGKSWGADTTVLLRLYSSLVRPRMDYGIEVYGQAAQSSLALLDPVQNRALRIATGALRSSPVAGLEILTTTPPLILHFQHRMSCTYLRLLSRPLSPLLPLLEEVSNPQPFWPFAHVVNEALNSIGISHLDILPLPIIAPVLWLQPPPSICFASIAEPKHLHSTHSLRNTFLSHTSSHTPSVFVYTDGSKTRESTSAAVVFPDLSYSIRLPSWASNFTAELAALLLALHVILFHHTSITFTIFSDSRSALHSITSIATTHPIVSTIHSYLVQLHSRHKHVTFCWVPAHVDILGNTQADTLARQAHTSPSPPPSLPHPFPLRKVPARDLYPYLKQKLQRSWQQRWTSSTSHPYLHLLFPDVPRSPLHLLPSRFLTVIRTRLLLGHTLLTHSHLMSGSPPPTCPYCRTHTPLTVIHLIFFCPPLQPIRKRFFKPTISSNEQTFLRSHLLSSTENFQTLITFLKAIRILFRI